VRRARVPPAAEANSEQESEQEPEQESEQEPEHGASGGEFPAGLVHQGLRQTRRRQHGQKDERGAQRYQRRRHDPSHPHNRSPAPGLSL
jgi:hypothetical protein